LAVEEFNLLCASATYAKVHLQNHENIFNPPEKILSNADRLVDMAAQEEHGYIWHQIGILSFLTSHLRSLGVLRSSRATP
jgi:hypothetical protein